MEEGRGSSGYRRHHRTRGHGCAGGGTDGGGGEGGGGTLTLGALFAPTTYDPSGAEWGNRSPYYQAVFDTLLLATPEGTIEPWLATEWSFNEDKTVLTLKLRNDVKFTDGPQFTADVAAQNIQRFQDGTSPDASNLANVTNSRRSTTRPSSSPCRARPGPARLPGPDPGLIGSPRRSTPPTRRPTRSAPAPTSWTPATVTGTKYVYTKNPDYWNPDCSTTTTS